MKSFGWLSQQLAVTRPVIPLTVPYQDMRLRQRGGVKLLGQRTYSRNAGIQVVRNECFCQHQTDKVSGLSSMVNTCELLLNVVKLNKPKVLTGLNQKVSSWTASPCIVVVDIRLPAQKGNLTYSGIQMKHGKPVFLLV
jgi:hypothetical protein